MRDDKQICGAALGEKIGRAFTLSGHAPYSCRTPPIRKAFQVFASYLHCYTIEYSHQSTNPDLKSSLTFQVIEWTKYLLPFRDVR